jgi:hypothetical protein
MEQLPGYGVAAISHLSAHGIGIHGNRERVLERGEGLRGAFSFVFLFWFSRESDNLSSSAGQWKRYLKSAPLCPIAEIADALMQFDLFSE